MSTGKLNEFTEDGSRTVIYCSHDQLTPIFSKIISRTDVCHADHKSTRVPPPPVFRGCSPCVHFFRGVSIYITHLCESVSYWHFQISTLSVSLDRYRASVDHGMSNVFWKLWLRAFLWLVCCWWVGGFHISLPLMLLGMTWTTWCHSWKVWPRAFLWLVFTWANIDVP